MITDLILGTAGHIDHGKTSLIRALTGTDTDRLPEEKKRGITIELGFAELTVEDFRLGIVDVPGHEKFVRQMLAGATGMDLAMLVIAADDSVKTQTREHLDVLRILDLPAGVIAMTKCDLADPDWIDLVEEEIRELVKDTFLADAPIVRTSSATGEGLDDLKKALVEAAKKSSTSRLHDPAKNPFRMPIDRAFTIAGHGTVVTGSVASGLARVGDQLVIEPEGIEVRIRGLQNHDRTVDQIQRGQRAAINLAGIHRETVTRGHELLSVGFLVSSRLITAKIQSLPDSIRPIRNRSKVRLHMGTAEVLATIALLEGDKINPGEDAWGQLFLNEPVACTWNQPFVLRNESPVETIAGGRVLVPVATKVRRLTDVARQYLNDLESEDELVRSSAAIYFAGASHTNDRELARTAGIADTTKVYEALVKKGDLVSISTAGQRKIQLHKQILDEYADRICSALDKLHEQNPLSTIFERATLANAFDYLGPTSVFEAILNRMEKSGRVRQTAKGVGLADRGPKLSKNERQLLADLIRRFKEARFQPPTIKECQENAPKNRESVPQLISLAASDGDLIEFHKGMYLNADVERELRETLRSAFLEDDASKEAGGLTMSQIREMLGTSRKFAVPICEYLDKIGFTERDGDLRKLSLAEQQCVIVASDDDAETTNATAQE